MSWTAPSTVVAGTQILASWGNSNVRDNSLFLYALPQFHCDAFHSTTQSVTVGTTASLSLDSELVDTNTMHDTVTNNNRITIQTNGGGTYLAIGQSFTTGSGTNYLHLRKNGTTAKKIHAGTTVVGNLVHLFRGLVAGDYLEIAGEAVTNTGNWGSSDSALATRLEVIGPLPPT